MLLWKLSRGYAKIESEYSRPERFINEAMARGISLHNIERLSRTRFRAIVRYSRLDELYETASELGCGVEIVGCGGVDVFLRSALKRPALIVSVFFALVMLSVLSSRVLAIDVSAWDTNVEQEARAFLSENGVHIGMKKSGIASSGLEEKLMMVDESVGDLSVWTDGVVLRVELKKSDRHTMEDAPPSSIYADKDCIILKIAAFDGKACVSVGQAVKKDQLLVDGDITPEQAETTVKTHSSAEITGQVAYSFSIKVDKSALAPTRSGQSQKLTRIFVFGFSFDSEVDYEDYTAELDRSDFLDASPIPIRISDGSAFETVLKTVDTERDEMIKRALELGRMRILASIPSGARIISKSTEFEWAQDGSLTAVFNIQTIEKIGYTRLI